VNCEATKNWPLWPFLDSGVIPNVAYTDSEAQGHGKILGGGTRDLYRCAACTQVMLKG
jgi:hypothetical protein